MLSVIQLVNLTGSPLRIRSPSVAVPPRIRMRSHIRIEASAWILRGSVIGAPLTSANVPTAVGALVDIVRSGSHGIVAVVWVPDGLRRAVRKGSDLAFQELDHPAWAALAAAVLLNGTGERRQ